MSLDTVRDLDDLRARVSAGQNHFAILLAGGLAYSRKTIRARGRKWANHIDDTRQILGDDELWIESNIGPALDVGALVVR